MCASQIKFKRFVILGDPTPLARPRYTGNRRVYDCQKEKKLIAGIEMQRQLEDNFIKFEGPLSMEIFFFMPIAASMSPSKREKRIGTYHSARPDLSNMIKFYEDVGNELLYHDDCYIAIINAKKVYDEIPRTEIIIRKLEE